MNNGCPKCEKIRKETHISTLHPMPLCLDCQLEHAEWLVMADMNAVEELKKKIAKEKERELPTNKG